MVLSDKEKQEIKSDIFDLIKEAHIRIFQYNDNILPGWGRCGQQLVTAARMLYPPRTAEMQGSAAEARDRNEAAAKAKKEAAVSRTVEPVKTRTPRKARTKAAPKKDA